MTLNDRNAQPHPGSSGACCVSECETEPYCQQQKITLGLYISAIVHKFAPRVIPKLDFMIKTSKKWYMIIAVFTMAD